MIMDSPWPPEPGSPLLKMEDVNLLDGGSRGTYHRTDLKAKTLMPLPTLRDALVIFSSVRVGSGAGRIRRRRSR